ncbi:hypothetical protein BGX34_010709 [Mortierella sp. NVP85]|nr:hypothetical protein BGX34_010709 [Mortierella sp. NVP85]
MAFFSDLAHKVTDFVTGEDHDHHAPQQKNVEAEGSQENRNPLLDEDDDDEVAIEAARQGYASISPSSLFKIGPVLRFQDIDVPSRKWIGSALIVSEQQDPPQLVVRALTKKAKTVHFGARLLDSWEGNHFYRYDIELSVKGDKAKSYEYYFESNEGQRWNFYVPALDKEFNWAFYSCNGFTSDVEKPEEDFHGANPLWDDLLGTHRQKPFHALVGGGDQIYNDAVLDVPEIEEWLKLGEEERIATVFSNEKKYAVEKYYFDHYHEHFTTGTYSKALSLIPSVNTWDDHDILDGYGSYPANYQLCSVMQGIGSAASRFYLLFQQHAGYDSTTQAGLETSRSGKGWNTITHFGKQTLVVCPDTRSERSKETILSNETYELLETSINNKLLDTTRHLVIVLGTPLVYPALTLFEDTLDAMGNALSRDSIIGKVFGKNKAFQNVLGHFGPELLDDLVDSWACNIHTAEKVRLVELLQRIAKARSVRVTFVGGDVHVGGAGRLFSTESTDPLRDPGHMVQIVSSAIVNAPPPGGVIHALHQASKTYKLNDWTSEEMTDIFHQDVNGEELEHKKLLNRRNWCEVRQLSGMELEFTLHVENLDHVGSKEFRIRVDRLEGAQQ